MRRALAVGLASILLVGCGQGVWLSREDAISSAAHEKGVAGVKRREAKLMTWPEFVKAAQLQNVDQYAPPGKQRIWLVAVSGNVQLRGAHEHWVIFIYNAVTGAQIADIPGPYDEMTGEATGEDWPPGWETFPDRG